MSLNGFIFIDPFFSLGYFYISEVCITPVCVNSFWLVSYSFLRSGHWIKGHGSDCGESICVGCSSEGVMMLYPTLPRSECETIFSRRPSKSFGQYECPRTMLDKSLCFPGLIFAFELAWWAGTFYFWPKFLFFLLSFLPRSSLSTCGPQGLN